MNGKNLESFRNSNKGQSTFTRLWQAAISLGIFVLVVALVAMMTQEVHDVAAKSPILYTVTNESTAFGAAGTKRMTHRPINSITGIVNLTDALTAVTNYNLTNSDTGNITIGGSGIIVDATWNVTYVREVGSAAQNVTVEGLSAVQLLSEWQTIVVIAIVMIVLIGLILREFGYLGG